jgi:hypothetical protein
MLSRLWDAAAANFLTPSIWTILAIVISHMLHRRAIATHMDQLRDHITAHLHHPTDERT